MVLPHYAYLKIKMPGNNGTNIMVHGSFSRSDNCDREFQKIAAKFGIKQEVKALDFISKKLALENKDSKLK
jgi:murein L,D-transpeptidase YafK